MSDGSKKLKKIRTFRDDFELVKGGSGSNLPPVEKPSPIKKEGKAKDPVPEIKKPLPKDKPLPPPPTLPKTDHHQAPPKELLEQKSATTDTVKETPKNTATPTNPSTIEEYKNTASTPLQSSVKNDTKNFQTESSLNVMETEDALSEGSIVSDKKRDRFRLLPAIWQSITDWLEKEKDEYETAAKKRAAATPKVRAIKDRKDVIERAASGSTLATKRERLHIKKKDKEDKSSAPVQIKKKSEASKPSWSHFSDQEEKNKETTKTENTENITPEPTPTPEPKEKPVQESPVSPKETVATKETSQSIPEINMVSPTIKADTIPDYSSRNEEEKPSEITAPTTPKPAEKPAKKPVQKKKAPAQKRTGTFSIFRIAIAGFVGIVAIAMGAGVTFWIFNMNDNESAPTVVNNDLSTPKTFTPNVNEKTVSLTNSRSTFLKELITTRTEEAKLVKVIPLADNQPTSVEQLLNTLDFSASGIFLRNINSVSLAWWRGEPVIILRTKSFDSAFGGILEWENDMSSDLNPWFGETVTGTFNPNFEGEDKVVSPFFADELVNNLDIRVLRDNMQKERITYGFKGRNTIIITTDSEAFASVSKLVE